MRAVEKLLASKRLLTHLARDFTPVGFLQTFSMEDLVAADLVYDDLVHQEYSSIKMFTIDTRQLSNETHRSIEQMRRRYGDVLAVYYADATELEPLRRALYRYKALITSSSPVIRAIHHRPWIAWDTGYQIPCFNPLSRWSKDEILSYAKHRNLPVHDSSYHLHPQPRIPQSGVWPWQSEQTAVLGYQDLGYQEKVAP